MAFLLPLPTSWWNEQKRVLNPAAASTARYANRTRLRTRVYYNHAADHTHNAQGHPCVLVCALL